VRLARAEDIPPDSGAAVKYGEAQLAIFHLGGAWYATQNACSHTGAMVLGRGIVGDDHGTPKVACPLHKKTFDLATGACLSKDAPAIAAFPVRIENDEVWALLPPVEDMPLAACAHGAMAS
jgi:NAD(P)H-dependent nitrite reductase small subunit